MGLNETVKACGLVSNNWICLERDRETPVVGARARTYARGVSRVCERLPYVRWWFCVLPPTRASLFLLLLAPHRLPCVTLFSLPMEHGHVTDERITRARSNNKNNRPARKEKRVSRGYEDRYENQTARRGWYLVARRRTIVSDFYISPLSRLIKSSER